MFGNLIDQEFVGSQIRDRQIVAIARHHVNHSLSGFDEEHHAWF